jgi:hypothetical protein
MALQIYNEAEALTKISMPSEGLLKWALNPIS